MKNRNASLREIGRELNIIARELQYDGRKIALSPLQEEYQEYFLDLLEKHDLKGISGADQKKLRAFFDDVRKGWIKGEGAK